MVFNKYIFKQFIPKLLIVRIPPVSEDLNHSCFDVLFISKVHQIYEVIQKQIF